MYMIHLGDMQIYHQPDIYFEHLLTALYVFLVYSGYNRAIEWDHLKDT